MHPGTQARPERINAQVYHSRKIVGHYTDLRLTPMETAALLKFQKAFFNRDILDIGVGTGRTTRYLAPLAQRYLAIDYSPVMVGHMAVTLPNIDVRQFDMCELDSLPAASFDFVFAPNNVLDSATHERRLLALRQWRRLLRSDGIVMFSSHNRRHRAVPQGPRLRPSSNPVQQMQNLLRFARSSVNFIRLARQRLETSEFALWTDSGHDHSLLHYYIDRGAACAQLRACGYRCIDVIGCSGRPAELPDEEADSPSLMYVARVSD